MNSRTEENSPRIRKVMVAVLAALFMAQLGAGVYDLLFTNYLSDAQGLNAQERGFLELPRELPGVLSLLVMGSLFFLNEVRLAAVSVLLAAMGSLFMMNRDPITSRLNTPGNSRGNSKKPRS